MWRSLRCAARCAGCAPWRPSAMTPPATDAEAPGSGRVRALFADLAHGGDLPEADGAARRSEAVFRGEAGSREQGTLVRVQLRLRICDRTVSALRYRAFGCPCTLAACEWLARELSGRALATLSARGLTAAVGTPAQWCEALGIPPARLGRLLVIEDALLAALRAAGGEGEPSCDAARICSASDNP